MRKFLTIALLAGALAASLSSSVRACDYRVGASFYYRAPLVYSAPVVYQAPAPTYAAIPTPAQFFAPQQQCNSCNCNNVAPPVENDGGVPYEAPMQVPAPTYVPQQAPPVVYQAPQPSYAPTTAFTGGIRYGAVTTLSSELVYRQRSPVVYSAPRVFAPRFVPARTFYRERVFAPVFAAPVFRAPVVKTYAPRAFSVGASFSAGFAPGVVNGGGVVATQFRRGGFFPGIGRALFGARTTQFTDVGTGASFAVRGRVVR
jgi:hypothetical protein